MTKLTIKIVEAREEEIEREIGEFDIAYPPLDDQCVLITATGNHYVLQIIQGKLFFERQ